MRQTHRQIYLEGDSHATCYLPLDAAKHPVSWVTQQSKSLFSLVVLWVLLMNTNNAYSDEEIRKFQDMDFDAESVERLRSVSGGLDECRMRVVKAAESRSQAGPCGTWGAVVWVLLMNTKWYAC